jgi:hypothetical protein
MMKIEGKVSHRDSDDQIYIGGEWIDDILYDFIGEHVIIEIRIEKEGDVE